VRSAATRTANLLLGAAGIVVVLILPWYVSVQLGVKEVILPPIERVLASGVELLTDGVLVSAAAVSIARVSAGFVIAVLSAVPLGIVLGRSARLFALFEPIIESFRFVIPFAWIPLAILWFGTHEAGKLFIIWYAGFFIMLLQTIDGVRNVDRDLVDAARTLGANEAHIFGKVILPAAVPSIMTGLRIGIATCWISVLAAEMVAARSGLGYLVMDAREFLATDVVLVGMVVIGVIGELFNWIFQLVQRRLSRHRVQFERL
jgi:ABC-type nitrate/sulfonate/bicarbonate transport system permease component